MCCLYMMGVFSKGAFIVWGFCPGGFCPWGFCPSGVLSYSLKFCRLVELNMTLHCIGHCSSLHNKETLTCPN